MDTAESIPPARTSAAIPTVAPVATVATVAPVPTRPWSSSPLVVKPVTSVAGGVVAVESGTPASGTGSGTGSGYGELGNKCVTDPSIAGCAQAAGQLKPAEVAAIAVGEF